MLIPVVKNCLNSFFVVFHVFKLLNEIMCSASAQIKFQFSHAWKGYRCTVDSD